jgi:hypothetical protein
MSVKREVYDNFPASLYYLITAMIGTLVEAGDGIDAVGLLDDFQIEVEELHRPALTDQAYQDGRCAGYDEGYDSGYSWASKEDENF